MTTCYTSNAEVQSVSSIVNDLVNNKRIDLEPTYQRSSVWNSDNQSAFIFSVIRGTAPTNLIFTNNEGKRICIDGKQRCIALKDFKSNQVTVEIDEKEYFYGPNKSDVPKDVLDRKGISENNVNILDSKLRDEFDDRKLSISTYKNLDFNAQCDIFSQIQYGKHLTQSETMLSKIPDLSSCEKMKQYCEANRNALKYYFGGRNAHYMFIVELMFLLDRGLVAISSKNINTFLNSLKVNSIDTLSKRVNTIIKKLFTDSVFNKSKVIKEKLARTELRVYCFKIYDKLLASADNLDKIHDKKLVELICKVHSRVKDFDKKTTKESMTFISNEFDKIYDEMFNNSDSDDDSRKKKKKNKKETKTDDEKDAWSL